MNSGQTIQYASDLERTEMSDMIGTLYAICDEMAQCTSYSKMVNTNLTEVIFFVI